MQRPSEPSARTAPGASPRSRWRGWDPWIVGATSVVAIVLVVGLVNTWVGDPDDRLYLGGLLVLGLVGLGLAVRANPAAAVVAVTLVAAEVRDPAPGGTWAVAGGLLFLFALQRPRLDAVLAGVTFGATGMFAEAPWSASWLDARVVGIVTLAGAMVGVAQWVQAQRRYVVAEVGRRHEETERRRVEVARGVAEERLRIARDLHDSVAHHIAVVSVQTNLARASLSVSTAAADRALQVVQTAARDVLADLQQVLGVLREEPRPDTAALTRSGSVRDLAASFGEIGLQVESSGLDLLPTAPAEVGATVYRVVQEAFTNAHRYGDGHAVLSLERAADGVLVVTVRNVVDASAVAAGSGGGHGLVGMTERVGELGGSLTAGVDGPEFVVRASVPGNQGEDEDER